MFHAQKDLPNPQELIVVRLDIPSVLYKKRIPTGYPVLYKKRILIRDPEKTITSTLRKEKEEQDVLGRAPRVQFLSTSSGAFREGEVESPFVRSTLHITMVQM
ncbi:hypothetical protein K435DRAFT_840564 [Dendrothele bispora CBS 962.96]|uniref:Uncharacterized protein n=1 Tax=Dendrothele bispora (strain CBS 962.96) TaxID=1314807 RepID=A0A4S8LU94_DENBC|nr:hypothetical protein K435DRAFT_844043 [Dendrothele bispora CBS 962.96]THU92568.1 hypothetical protein K435DRAFT_840564 [Dendrothele bispora CBS 962.96]